MEVSRAAGTVTVSRSRAGGQGSPGQVLPARAGTRAPCTGHRALAQPRRVLGAGCSVGSRMGAGSVVAGEHGVLMQGVMIAAYAGY